MPYAAFTRSFAFQNIAWRWRACFCQSARYFSWPKTILRVPIRNLLPYLGEPWNNFQMCFPFLSDDFISIWRNPLGKHAVFYLRCIAPHTIFAAFLCIPLRYIVFKDVD